MNPETALLRLKQRNQAFVNKAGKTSKYSRESDEIISALSRLYNDSQASYEYERKVFLLGSILNISPFYETLKNVPLSFLELLFKHKFEEYQDENGKWHRFDRNNLGVFLRQIEEAYILHEQSCSNVDDRIAEIKQEIKETPDEESVKILTDWINELGEWYSSLDFYKF